MTQNMVQKNLIQITTPAYSRIIDMASHTYTHYPKIIDKTKKKTPEESNFLAEIAHPQGKIMITKSASKEHLIIQNSQYPALPKTKKRSKRPLLHLEMDRVEDRFYEDGSIVHGTDRSSTSAPNHCKVQIIQRENGGHEMTVSFTSLIRPPQPIPQTSQTIATSQTTTETIPDKQSLPGITDKQTNEETINMINQQNNANIESANIDIVDNITVEVGTSSETAEGDDKAFLDEITRSPSTSSKK